MRIQSILVLALIALVMTNCSPLNLTTFNATTNGVEYKYEVVVPLTNFVRVTAITPADQLTGEVVIPPTVKYDGTNYVVSQIGKSAFEGYSGITEMTIPSTISVIEEKAFRNCMALREINTPQPLSSIGDYAFEGCSSLESYGLQASISKLGEGCFRNCTSLTSVTFPTSLNNIPAKAFEGCTALEEIYIDRNMLTIGEKTFFGCAAVTDFTCLTPTPPTASSNTFEGMDAGLPVTVPMANIEQYRTATGWSYFTNYQGQ
ncbi:MAG: leucine-rich repeat domain-containing protein [Bacteroidales bacterium]|nr:leucine-rich repeat domain-containing protein [Bacteroidales bacterium]